MSSKPVSVHEAKTHLSRLIERAEASEDVVIARGETPVVRLVPIDAPKVERRFGAMKGKAKVSAAFFDALPESELADSRGECKEGEERRTTTIFERLQCSAHGWRSRSSTAAKCWPRPP